MLRRRLGFHDFGWYEFLYLALVVVPVFLYLDRKPRAPGFWLPAFAALYAPVRFGLDFLRVPDPTYGGLTPAQWSIVALLLAGGAWLAAGRRFRAPGSSGSNGSCMTMSHANARSDAASTMRAVGSRRKRENFT